MTDVSIIAVRMEHPINKARSLACAIQCLSEAIDHDPRLREALEGLGLAIYEAMDELEEDREAMKRAAA